MRYIVGIALLALLFGAPVRSQGVPAVRWTVEHDELGKKAVVLGDRAEEVMLKGEWRCVIGQLSDQLPLYQARRTTCTSGERVVEFSVQCEPSRPKDHTQLRFKDSSGKMLDFIGVSCEFQA